MKKVGEGRPIVSNKGFGEARIDALAEVDPKLADDVSGLDRNDDGRVQLRELVDGADPALARRYVEATRRLFSEHAPGEAHMFHGLDDAIGLAMVGGPAAALSAMAFFDAAAGLAATGTGPVDAMPLLSAAPFLAGFLVVGGKMGLRGAKIAAQMAARQLSPDHRRLQQLLSDEAFAAARARIEGSSS